MKFNRRDVGCLGSRNTERVALIVKYFPKSKRISGLTSFATLLASHMAAYCQLHVFSRCTEEEAEELCRTNDYIVHPVREPFWLRVAAHIKRVGAAKVIVLSGVHRAGFLYFAFKPLFASLAEDTDLYFYQATILTNGLTNRFQNLLRNCRGVICTVPALKLMLSQEISRHFLCLPPGVDLEHIRNCAAETKEADIRVGFFNHFNKIKGFDLALAAFSALPFEDTEYVIAGRGPLEKNMMKKYAGNEKIKFRGGMKDPIPAMKACDFLVLPFRTSASVLGISQTVLESLAAGVPVIGSTTEAITSVVSDNKEGLIFKRPEELTDCIRQLHDDGDLRQRLAQGALEKSKYYDIKVVAKKLYDFIKEVQE